MKEADATVKFYIVTFEISKKGLPDFGNKAKIKNNKFFFMKC